jgi:hypothetical protein
MKTIQQKWQILTAAALLSVSLLTAGITGCGKSSKINLEIPFTEYSLAYAGCQWTNLGYDSKSKVNVINSETEVEKHLTCTEGESFPEIDFAKNTLLLARGIATSGVGKITGSFYQSYANQYSLNIKISLGITAVMQPWSIGIVVSKLPVNVKINLNVLSSYYD